MVFAQTDSIVEHKGAADDGKDPIKPWFQASIDLGDHIGIRFGHLPPDSEEPEWQYFSHADYDGIGGFADILRTRGFDPGTLPSIPHPAPRTWWPFLRSMYLYLTPRERVTWKKRFGGKAQPRHDKAPESVAWHIFDRDTTNRIIAACKNTNYTVNSFLLAHLGEALFPDAAEDTRKIGIMVPVNLRGKVNRTRDTENHVSFVRVPMERKDSPSRVHQKIYRELNRGEHWANWNAYTATRFIPLKIRRAMVKADLVTSQYTVGVFSNIGVWNRDGQFPLEGDWLFAPPAMRFFMIAAGCVTWNGRLSLCLHLHPEISADPQDARDWISSWTASILNDL